MVVGMVVVRADVPGLAVRGVAAGGGGGARLFLRFRLCLCCPSCCFLLFGLLPRQHRPLDVAGHAVQVVPADPEHPARVHLLLARGRAHQRGQRVDRAQAGLELPQGRLAGAQQRSLLVVALVLIAVLLLRRRFFLFRSSSKRGVQDEVALVEDDAVGVRDLRDGLRRRLGEELRREGRRRRRSVSSSFSILLLPSTTKVQGLPEVPPPVDRVDQRDDAVEPARSR